MNSSWAAAAPPGWWAAGGGAAITTALPVLLSGVCVASASGNVLLLAVLAHELRRGRLPAALALLLPLGAADLLLALYCLPARAAAYARRSWQLGAFACRTSEWLLQGGLAAKSLAWAAVGQARYRHVARPGPPPRGRGWRRLAATGAAAWAAALLLALPHLLFARLQARSCAFAAPAGARRFVEVFGQLYPLLAGLAPSGFGGWCAWRALRLQRRQKSRRDGPAGTRLLLGLGLLFHAMWLPEWVLWLWERHGAPAPPSRAGSGRATPPPPAALGFAAELLLFLNGALSPGLLLALSEELRDGLRSVCRGRCAKEPDGAGQDWPAGETPDAPRELPAEDTAAAAEKVLPDVEHFWKDRRNTVAGEESDPVPWEHQGGP
ncbi:G-protein coupled receptor 151-like [Elgaria multicarinata webbii]|uniref:G-protein coupled receptor 151-like n=1 Tax=Elgaria multicarinata webbii TaxID=159646 RepID=UPI002FCD38F2